MSGTIDYINLSKPVPSALGHFSTPLITHDTVLISS